MMEVWKMTSSMSIPTNVIEHAAVQNIRNLLSVSFTYYQTAAPCHPLVRREADEYILHHQRYAASELFQAQILYIHAVDADRASGRVIKALEQVDDGAFAGSGGAHNAELTMQGEMSLGSLGAFVEYSMNIVWPMEMLGWLTNSFSAAMASNRKLNRIYEEKPSIVEKESPVVLEKLHIHGPVSAPWKWRWRQPVSWRR